MFKYIKEFELFNFGGRHFASEDFIRMHTFFIKKDVKANNWTHNPYELLVIVLKGNGSFITPDKTVEFNSGDQIYSINTDFKFIAKENLELEFINLPGLYGSNLFASQKSETIHISQKELLKAKDKIFVNEIYGKMYVQKFKNEIYQNSLKSREELIIICLEGSCQFRINSGSFGICQGEQVYLKNEFFELSIGSEVILEFIYAPSETYTNMIISRA